MIMVKKNVNYVLGTILINLHALTHLIIFLKWNRYNFNFLTLQMRKIVAQRLNGRDMI